MKDASKKAERMFLALWPDHVVRQRLEAARSLIAVAQGRAVPSPNLHVTLVFLGSIGNERRQCVERMCDGVAAEEFVLRLETVEVKRRSGIVWAATRTVPAALAHLVDELNRGLAGCGHVIEERRFRPHVTLWRDVGGMQRSQIEPIDWRVREFCLVASTPTAVGSAYVVRRRWPLRVATITRS